ncbi:MAG TPA: transposase [Terracidiphilus sp.]|nr:transposase [Terracidiphilus sp.]
MARPPRVTDSRSGCDQPRTFFVSSQTAGRRALFQSERMAELLIDVLRTNALSGRFTIHDFVVMPNHMHLLITVPGDLSIEKVVQLIKGGLSYRAKRELGCTSEIWQKGFSEVGVRDRESFLRHREYIEQNPVTAGLAGSPEAFPFGSSYFKRRKYGLQDPANTVISSG